MSELWRVVMVSVGVVSACAHVNTYGYQSRFDAQFLGAEEPEAPPVEARQLLANARTVAFFPPDTCLNATPTESQQDKVLRARCGVLLSKLERDAERAGYEVVSWVNLRGGQRPIDYARDAKVDVLFEINELSPQRIKASEAKRQLSFFERNDAGVDRDLAVSNEVGRRCYRWATGGNSKDETAGLRSTLDIKTVSVADGRARWHYRKTVSTSTGTASPKVRFVGVSKPSKGAQTVLGLGIGLLISGAVFAIVDEAVAGTPDPVTGMPKEKLFGSYPYYLIAGGGLGAVGGGVFMATSSQARPSPDDVLCLEDHVPANGTIEATASAAAPSSASSQHTFNESNAGSVDEELSALIDKLAAERVSEFVTILTDVRMAVTRAAPAPPAPSPPPAAPPAPSPPPPR